MTGTVSKTETLPIKDSSDVVFVIAAEEAHRMHESEHMFGVPYQSAGQPWNVHRVDASGGIGVK